MSFSNFLLRFATPPPPPPTRNKCTEMTSVLFGNRGVSGLQIFKARFYSFGILRGLEKIGDPLPAPQRENGTICPGDERMGHSNCSPAEDRKNCLCTPVPLDN